MDIDFLLRFTIGIFSLSYFLLFQNNKSQFKDNSKRTTEIPQRAHFYRGTIFRGVCRSFTGEGGWMSLPVWSHVPSRRGSISQDGSPGAGGEFSAPRQPLPT